MNPLSSDPLRQAEQAIHDGKINEARAMLIDYVKRDPNYDRAWWLLTFTLTDLTQQIDCLKRVLSLNPGHAQAREWLAKLKKTGSLPPLKPAVNPFVSGPDTGSLENKPEPPAFSSRTEKPSPIATSMWPAPEHKSTPSVKETLPPRGQTLSAAPVTPPPDTTPPVWTLPEDEKPEPPKPGKPAPDGKQDKGQTPPGKKPRKKNTWIVDLILVSVILCVAVTAGAIYWFNLQAQYLVQDLQQTMESVPAQTSTPSRTPYPTQTPSNTRTPVMSHTPSETPTSTPTLEFTLTPSPIPANLIGPAVSLFPPDFTLINAMTGEQVSLSDYYGQPMVLFFWATTCKVCKTDLPNLQAVYEKYAGEDLMVLAIDTGESAATATNYWSANGLSFPLLLDTDQAVYRAYQVSELPHYIFIGRNSRITLIEYSNMDMGELEWQVKILLRKFPTQTP